MIGQLFLESDWDSFPKCGSCGTGAEGGVHAVLTAGRACIPAHQRKIQESLPAAGAYKRRGNAQVLETMRTLFVWIGGLALYYSSGTGKIGEQWTKYSWFQVQASLGFVCSTAAL